MQRNLKIHPTRSARGRSRPDSRAAPGLSRAGTISKLQNNAHPGQGGSKAGRPVESLQGNSAGGKRTNRRKSAERNGPGKPDGERASRKDRHPQRHFAKSQRVSGAYPRPELKSRKLATGPDPDFRHRPWPLCFKNFVFLPLIVTFALPFRGKALVAQLVEQMTLNHWAQGSSPCESTAKPLEPLGFERLFLFTS